MKTLNNNSQVATNDIYGEELLRMHAAVCSTLAHPKRLKIMMALREHEVSAGELSEILKISAANLSQHLSLLRQAGVIKSRRDGLHIYYRISSPKIIQACNLMREVLMERLEHEIGLFERHNQLEKER